MNCKQNAFVAENGEEIEKSCTISKMVLFEHTWIIEPSDLTPHCPRCEIVTGTVRWELNGCLGKQGPCVNCGGPYLKLVSEPPRAANITIHEEGLDRRIWLPLGQYTLQPNGKLHVAVMVDSNANDPGRRKRRKIVSTFSLYMNIFVDPAEVSDD
uniref:Uncharacterized protein n=1 Tax=Anopheles atroparvus TaxID=41427 RepID=A0A182IU76_ANOAO